MGRRLVLPARHRRPKTRGAAGARRGASAGARTAAQRGGAGPAGVATQRGGVRPVPQAAAATTPAAAAASPELDDFKGDRPTRGGGGRGRRRDRGGRWQSAAPVAVGRGRGRGARGGRGAGVKVAVTSGPDTAMLDKVKSLVAGITAGTAALRADGTAGPSSGEPVAGRSGRDVDTKSDIIKSSPRQLKSESSFQEPVAGPSGTVDTKSGIVKSPPRDMKSAACRAASPPPVAGPSRSSLSPATPERGDVPFGVLPCTAVGLHYYPGLLTGGDEPVRLLLANLGAGGTRRDVRVVNDRGLTCGYLGKEFARVLAPHLEAGRVRLEGICVDQDRSSAALEVTVRGREQHRRWVCDELRSLGFELEESVPESAEEPADLFDPVKPGRSCSPERTLVAPRDPQQAVSERWAAVQRSLKEVEACAAVGSRLYKHQKQALGWMIARETNGAAAAGTAGVCGGILADDMGLGKTLQVIALILTHFKASRPLAVPVPWRRREPPAALALPALLKPKTIPLVRPSPKVDWSNFKARLKEACQKSPSVKAEGASGGGANEEEEVAPRRTRTKRKPVRYIDTSDEDEDEPAEMKRVKPEPTDAPSSASAGPSSGSAAAAETSSGPAAAAGASSGPAAGPAAESAITTIVLDSDDDLLADEDDSPTPGGGADAALVPTAAAGLSGSSGSGGGGEEWIPVPPAYCDHDGRSSWPGPRTTLIVCPLSVLDNWETQLEQHVHRNVHLKVRSYHGPRRSESDLVDADVVLTTYATLGRELDRGDDSAMMKNHFLRVVLDEGHTIRNPRSFMARAAYELRAERRWVLTGTPVQNRLKDLWSLVKFLRLEPYASERSLWRSRMEGPVMRGNPQAVERLQTLMADIALRRLKEQKVDGKPIVELPPRNVYIQHVAMEGEQRRRYETMEEVSRRRVARFIRDGTIVRRQVQILVMLLRLRQLCCHALLVPEHDRPLPEQDDEEGGAENNTDEISAEVGTRSTRLS